MKSNNFKQYLIRFGVLFIAALIAGAAIFFPGIARGNDSIYHLSQIYDLYHTMVETGDIFPKYNHYQFALLGYNVRIFYAPLGHLSVAWLSYFTTLPVHISYKIVLLLSFFLSGVTAYGFAKRLTKNEIAAIIAGIFYIITPYHIFNAFERVAFAEVLAFMTMPMIFSGIYDFIHNDKLEFKSVITLITGVSFTLLIHNITALYAVTIGLIYIGLNFKKVLPKLKSIKYWAFCLVTILFVVGNIAFYVIGMMQHLNLDIYRIEDEVLMGSVWWKVALTIGQVYGCTGIFPGTGFISGDTNYIIFEAINIFLCFVMIASLVLIIYLDIKNKQKGKSLKYRIITTSIIFIIDFILFFLRIQVLLAGLIFIFVYYVIYDKVIDKIASKKGLENIDVIEDDELKKNRKDMIILLIVLGFFMIVTPVWFFMPKIYRNIQFVFRLYMFVTLFVGVLLGSYVTRKISKEKTRKIIALALTSCIFFNSAMADVQIEYFAEMIGIDKEYVMYVDEHLITQNYNDGAVGAQQEYCPSVFFEEDYQSEYENSLYDEVKSYVEMDKYSFDDYEYIDPTFISGKGNIEITYRYVPNLKLNIEVIERGYIQLPQFYYLGYEIKDENKVYEYENIDGLVSFYLEEGNYQIEISYKGTKEMQICDMISIISFTTYLSISLIYGIYYFVKKHKKETVEINN